MAKVVWLVSYPKSGNTWFRMFLANYTSDSLTPLALGDIKETPISSNAEEFEEETGLNPFELTPEEVDLYRADCYRSQATRVADHLLYKKTHDAYSMNSMGTPVFPADISYGAVYFVRNPMDVCVSYANHGATEIEHIVKLMINEDASIAGKRAGQLRQMLFSWEGHYRSWHTQTEIPLHTVRYEDMINNPVETFGSIVRFLNLEFDLSRLKRAISNSDFDVLKKFEKEQGFKERMQNCDNFFWKGKIGNYRNFLNKEQTDRLVSNFSALMSELGYIDKKGMLTI